MSKTKKNSTIHVTPQLIVIFDVLFFVISIIMSIATQHDIQTKGCLQMKGGACITAYTDPINYWIDTHIAYIATGILIIMIPLQTFLYKCFPKQKIGVNFGWPLT